MSKRRTSQRVQHVIESDSGIVRRSPRLSARYSSGTGLGSFPLTSVTYSATSRPSLSGYTKDYQDTTVSVLNESGQSVPPSFDEDEGFAPTGLSPGGEISFQPGYISAATAQVEVAGDSDLPEHLYGLDESEDEYAQPDLDTPRQYHRYQTERVLEITPRTGKDYPDSATPGFFGRVYDFFLSQLYKLGSLLYLAVTAIICLDVIILHRLFTVYHSMAGGMETRPTKSWHRFWILPITLCALIVFLVGGGLMPTREPLPDPHFGTDPEIWKKIDNLNGELAKIKSTLNSEIENMEKHTRDDISAHKGYVKEELRVEAEMRENAIQQLKQDIWNELTPDLENLQNSLDEQISELLQKMLNMSAESGVTKEWISDLVKDMVLETGGQQLKNTKEELLQLAEKDKADMKASIDSVKIALMQALQDRDQRYLDKFDDLNNTARSYQSRVEDMASKLQDVLSAVSSLKKSAKTHDGELTALQQQNSELSESMSQFKEKIQARLAELEAQLHEQVDSAMVVNIFNEELRKTLDDGKSPLKSWLDQNFVSADSLKALENHVEELERAKPYHDGNVSGLSLTEVEQLIRETLHNYSADRIAKFDFALDNSGGSVIVDKCSKNYAPAQATVSLLGFSLWQVNTSPKVIIQPQVYPGDCWAFPGSTGHVLIKLKSAAVITGVTVEHIPQELSPDGKKRDTAPENFRVIGKNSVEDEEKGKDLGIFSYKLTLPPVQEFPIAEAVQPEAFQYVLFDFLSNHGNPDYTCVYRVRVHGHSMN